MALSIIGPGFGRTGTMSLKLALEQLGFGPCHHMEEVFKDPDQWPHWRAFADGERVDWPVVLERFRAQVDWPGANAWRELVAAFPDAKIVLSVRPEDAWWNSFSKTIGPFMQDYAAMELPPPLKAWIATTVDLIGRNTFDGNWMNEDVARAAYRKRIADVKAEIAPERLLEFNVAEGWTPLCAFLGKPVPATSFPRTNNQKEFWELFGAPPPAA